jgi:hypothetical protein
MSAEATKVVCSMVGVGRHCARMPVLEGISLSHFYAHQRRLSR